MAAAYFRAAAGGARCVPSGENIRRGAGDLAPFSDGRVQDAAQAWERTVETSASCLDLRLLSNPFQDEGRNHQVRALLLQTIRNVIVEGVKTGSVKFTVFLVLTLCKVVDS